MPAHKPPQSDIDLLLERSRKIGQTVDALKYKHRPTAPIYDYDALPQDAVEGQHALTTDGCYAWYQGGRWHEVCPDEGDPFVADPGFYVVASGVVDTQLTVASGIGPFAVGTTEFLLATHAVPNGDAIIPLAAIGTNTITPPGEVKTYLNYVRWQFESTFGTPGIDVSSGMMFLMSTGNEFVGGDQGDHGKIIVSGGIAGVPGPVAIGDKLVFRYTNDKVTSMKLGPRAYVILGLPAAAIGTIGGTILTGVNVASSPLGSGVFDFRYPKQDAVSATNDVAHVFGLATYDTGDKLNMSAARTIRKANLTAGLTGAGYTDKMVFNFSALVRTHAHSVINTSDMRITIPFTAPAEMWAASGGSVVLSSTT